MTLLTFALRAFWTIITGKPHIYVDNYQHGIQGYADEIDHFIDILIAEMEDDLCQQEVLHRAKEILEQKDNQK